MSIGSGNTLAPNRPEPLHESIITHYTEYASAILIGLMWDYVFAILYHSVYFYSFLIKTHLYRIIHSAISCFTSASILKHKNVERLNELHAKKTHTYEGLSARSSPQGQGQVITPADTVGCNYLSLPLIPDSVTNSPLMCDMEWSHLKLYYS